MSPHYSKLMFYLKIVFGGEDGGKAGSTAQRMASAAPSAIISLIQGEHFTACRCLYATPTRAAVPGTRLGQGRWIAAGQMLEFAWHHFIASAVGRWL